MRLFFLMALFLPVVALAQAPVASPSFPDWAVTTVGGEATAPPPAPENAAPAAVPQAPAAPAAPTSPAAPVSDIWPADTVPVFVRSCSRGRSELLAPCRCTIESLMKAMTQREFLALSEKNAVATDPRYMNVRQNCASRPQQ